MVHISVRGINNIRIACPFSPQKEAIIIYEQFMVHISGRGINIIRIACPFSPQKEAIIIYEQLMMNS